MDPTNTSELPNTQENQPSDAAIEMQAAIVADQIANPEPPAQENLMAETSMSKKGGKGMLVGIILLTIVALGGIGFGVWEMIDGNTQRENLEKQLKEQINSLKQQNDKLTEQLNGTSSNNNTNNPSSDVNPEDYIYIGEWGLKIKMPKDLVINEYSIKKTDTVSSLNIDLHNDSYNDEYYLATVVRTNNYDSSAPYEPAFSKDGYYYIVSHANGFLPEGEEAKLNLIVSILSNPDNYSAI